MAMTVGNFKKVQRSHFSLGFALTYLASLLGSTIKQWDMMSKGTRMWLNLMSFGKRTLLACATGDAQSGIRQRFSTNVENEFRREATCV